jgi:hypothetical protein
VAITARWRRAAGRAVLAVSGIERVLRRSPRPATRRTDRIIYHRVRRGQSIRATLITTWRDATRGATNCKIHLPRLTGTGVGASAAARGRVRLRTTLPVSAPDAPPQRGTGLDHIWSCGGARRGDFDCGLTVTLGSAKAGGPEDGPEGGPNGGDGDDDPPEWLAALLAAIGAAGLGAAGSARRRRPTEGGDMKETWDELARKEFAKPEEPISARASDLSKIGAPVAASATVILAVAGGFATDADPEFTVIGAALLVSVAAWGLFFVFATDFRTRAAVSVAGVS